MQNLVDLEKQGWQALSSEGPANHEFYSSVLRDDAVMLFPRGMFIDGKENILKSLATQPWASFQIEEPRVIPLSKGAEVVVYKVTAQREGSALYVALISSTYVLSGGMWKLEVGFSSADTSIVAAQHPCCTGTPKSGWLSCGACLQQVIRNVIQPIFGDRPP